MNPSAVDPVFEATYLSRYEHAKALSASMSGPSLADRFARLSPSEQGRVLAELSRADRARLLYSWRFWAREKQLVPNIPHRNVLWLGGRAMGKTRTAAERIRDRIYEGVRSIVIIGPTWREVLRYMVGGKRGAKRNGSGLLDLFPPHERKHIELKEQKGEIHFHFCDALVHLLSDEQPEFRGGGYELAWLDEVCKWKHLTKLWDNLEFSMREQGDVDTEVLITTTPRPMRFLKELIADPDTITIMGKTDENVSNLASSYVKRLDRKFGGSRIARQERGGEMLTDSEGALFHATIIEATRVLAAPAMVRVVVAIDPAISTKADNDETGIVAIGIDARGHIYVLGDASGKLGPEAWGAAALKLFDQHKADAFVGERNRGGDLVAANMRATIREKRGQHAVLPFVEVHATRNKEIRAEPVGTLHEQGRLHFVGVHEKIEQEITEWDPSLGGVSPNRLDAMVWGAYELAKLGEEDVADPREGFKGIAAMGQALNSAPRAPGQSIASLLGGAGSGGRI